MKIVTVATLFCLWAAPAFADPVQTESVILSVTEDAVTWADVFKAGDQGASDPYFHVRVFEKKKGTDPWVYKLMAPYLVVTPKALEASRTDKKAKTYAYKDVEFRYLFSDWRNNPGTRSKTPICKTDILDCISNQGK